MNAFVILSEAKDLTTGVANIKCLSRDQSPRERSLTVFAVRDDGATADGFLNNLNEFVTPKPHLA
jgi:hypothetical protein